MWFSVHISMPGTASSSAVYVVGMQELQTPELQPLSMESKAALALLKYLPLTPQVVPQVPSCLHAPCLLFQMQQQIRHI